MVAKRAKRATTYRDAGVDIEATDRFVDRLAKLTAATRDGRVLSDFRHFAGFYQLDLEGMEEPVLVATTDGVGTKLRIAHLTGRHDTVGIDLVAMCANDLITCGAKPLVFLDYFATGAFRHEEAVALISGIVDGCKQAGMVLIGGETAEMPGFYKKGEYDLAGFANGIVDRKKIIDGTRIAPGDVVLGVRSSGLHSNGYSLARRVLLERAKMPLGKRPKGLEQPLGEALLAPTRIYVQLVAKLLALHDLKGIAHITGGGLPDNIRRLLPPGCRVTIERESWQVPAIFRLIEKHGNVPADDMYRTFNMGIGLALIADGDTAARMERTAAEPLIRIGRVEAGATDVVIA